MPPFDVNPEKVMVPADTVKPFAAVSVDENLPVPVTSSVFVGLALLIPTFPALVMTKRVVAEAEAVKMSADPVSTSAARAFPPVVPFRLNLRLVSLCQFLHYLLR